MLKTYRTIYSVDLFAANNSAIWNHQVSENYEFVANNTKNIYVN